MDGRFPGAPHQIPGTHRRPAVTGIVVVEVGRSQAMKHFMGQDHHAITQIRIGQGQFKMEGIVVDPLPTDIDRFIKKFPPVRPEQIGPGADRAPDDESDAVDITV